MTFVSRAQPPMKHLLKVEVLGIPAPDSPLLMKYPDFLYLQNLPGPNATISRSYRLLEVSEAGSLTSSGVQAPGLLTWREVACGDERSSAWLEVAQMRKGIPSILRKHFRAQCEKEGCKR